MTTALMEKSPEKLLFQAGLLAGLGSQLGMRKPTDEIADLTTDMLKTLADNQPKSCISAGNSLILSLRAPGTRSLRIAQQIGETQRWIHTNYAHNNSHSHNLERWLTEFFLAKAISSGDMSSGNTPWPKTLNVARTLNAETKVQHYHRKLGARGRLLSLSQRLNAAPGGWVTWQLDKHYSPAAALADCDADWAWPMAAQHFQQLLGRAVSKYCRPWSLAIDLLDPQPRFRLGTTVWARQPESTEKHRRLAAVVAQMGGDSRFAEALYKLIAAEHPAGITRRIGRAVEIEFYEGQAVGMEFFLCAATP
ncbi:MAG: hypothetical protein AAFQ40_00135 [Cyanobacteria bacterium J06623_5]